MARDEEPERAAGLSKEQCGRVDRAGVGAGRRARDQQHRVGEHDGEPAQTRPVHVPGEMAGGLGDDDDVDEVIEELEEADLAPLDDIAMGLGRFGRTRQT